MQVGNFYAILGAALALIGGGAGSSMGVGWACQAGAGVVKENPDKFGKVLPLMLIPASQALYGMITAFLLLFQIGAFGTMAPLTANQGLIYLALSLPISVVGFFSAVYQGKVAVSGIALIGKRSEASGNAIVMAIMVEIFAIFALIVSLLGIILVKV